MKTLAVLTSIGDASLDASITHWSMKTLSTGSSIPQDKEGKKLPKDYTASTSFTVRFRDFTELGTFATMASTMEFVSVQQILWELTEATKATLGTKSRIEAINDAMQKANDYAKALEKANVTAYEVLDGHGGANSSRGYFSHGHGGYLQSQGVAAGGEELNFEPENVSFSCSVIVKCKAC